MAGARRLADEVRVGLDAAASTATAYTIATNSRKDPLAEIWFGKPIRQHVREFGALFGAICFFVTAYKLYRGQSMGGAAIWFGVGAAFAMSGLWAPRLLHPVWKGWMKFAHYLSIVMTAVILSLIWCIGFLPVACMLKVLRIKRIDLSYKTAAQSYWEARDTKYDDFKRLELQY